MGLIQQDSRIHFVGICGIGLSAIARVLNGWGYQVTGSDLQPSSLAVELRSEGITVLPNHQAEHVLGAGSQPDPSRILVVASSAIPDGNAELVEARRLGIPVVKRNQILGELASGRTTIAVAGTHGKTTTTAMIAWILTDAGLDPAFIVGGIIQGLDTNARAGQGRHFVIEADEYDRAFLGLHPEIGVVTTLEHDHPDCYPTFEEMRQAFAQFMQQVPAGGSLIVCGEDEIAAQTAAQVLDKVDRPAVAGAAPRLLTYGGGDGWDWKASNIQLGGSPTFDVSYDQEVLGTCALQLPGRHNVLNALAALAASREVGIEFDQAAAALTRFRGAARRFEMKGRAGGITVIDDYAHHPTEIRATLEAARTRYPDRPIWAVFQPHTYSRTAAFMDDFATCFHDADHVLVTRIYAARETDTLGVSGAGLVSRMKEADADDGRGSRTGGSDKAPRPDVDYVDTLEAAVSVLTDRARPGEIVITMGAGDGHLIGERLLDRLEKRAPADESLQHVNNSAEAAPCWNTYV
ncbi:UDP-N-acetylmuramate--L-alanine ligase [Chloroflexota bacterium]